MEPINHAFFVDDSLLLRGASIMIEKYFNTILHGYYSVSGTLINDSNTVVYGWNVEK